MARPIFGHTSHRSTKLVRAPSAHPVVRFGITRRRKKRERPLQTPDSTGIRRFQVLARPVL